MKIHPSSPGRVLSDHPRAPQEATACEKADRTSGPGECVVLRFGCFSEGSLNLLFHLLSFLHVKISSGVHFAFGFLIIIVTEGDFLLLLPLFYSDAICNILVPGRAE